MATTTPLPPGIPPTHPAVVITAPRAPLAILHRPTEPPGPGEALVHVEWTSSTPLDLHQADGGLLIDPPHVAGSSFGGTVVALGPADASTAAAYRKLSVGDQVFGMAWEQPRERGFQTFITAPTYLMSKLPENITMQEAVTVSTNLVTVLHTLTKDLELEMRWPLSSSDTNANEEDKGDKDKEKKQWILVWGAASSVGQYALQVLKYGGYRNVIAVASKRHHQELLALGAAVCFDYGQEGVTDLIRNHVAAAAASSSDDDATIPLVLDCIGDLEGTLRPLTRLAEKGTKVAIMLPVIIKHATEDEPPEYEIDVTKVLKGEWKDGVVLRGVRTHFYTHDEFMKYHCQPDIVPALLEQGVVKPNKQRIVEGATLLERATNALRILRNRAQSGEKLVWRVDEKSAQELFPDLFVSKADPTKVETII
ncbi:chaperonin 10-like protein [Neurospora tetraspora]|uniref:Chaperonin 10-like protein n=1 Tax=Neurospora tetraspora TaxID=94610 RepID=A0AAE0JQQ9_9PEZI|nr:chaperonin 10-like protein [Neurospora tetraspora]